MKRRNRGEDRVQGVDAGPHHFDIVFKSRKILRVPWTYSQRLRNATKGQRQRFELSEFGIHWPDVDEDLSFAGLQRAASVRWIVALKKKAGVLS
jgi:Protein of unknown function (DUF2442)